MKKTKSIFNLKFVDTTGFGRVKRVDGGFYYRDRDNFIQIGDKMYHAMWKGDDTLTDSKYVQVDEFYESTTHNFVDRNYILGAILNHVLPKKFIDAVVRIFDAF